MPTLYRSLTIDRFWSLLEDSTGFTTLVTASRRIKDTEIGWLRRLMFTQVGWFPLVQISMGDNFTIGEIPSTTFKMEPGTFGDDDSEDWVEQETADFKATIIYETPNFDKQDELEMEFVAALKSGGRNLGYTAITKWGPCRGRRGGLARVQEQDRPATQIVIPVAYQLQGSELKP